MNLLILSVSTLPCPIQLPNILTNNDPAPSSFCAIRAETIILLRSTIRLYVT